MGLSVSKSPATAKRLGHVHPTNACVEAEDRNTRKTSSSSKTNNALSASRRHDVVGPSPSLAAAPGGGSASWRRFSLIPSSRKRDKGVWSKLADRILKKSHRQRVSVQSEDLENNNEKAARCVVVDDRAPRDSSVAPSLPGGGGGRYVSRRISCSDKELKDLTNIRNKTSENCSSETHRTKNGFVRTAKSSTDELPDVPGQRAANAITSSGGASPRGPARLTSGPKRPSINLSVVLPNRKSGQVKVQASSSELLLCLGSFLRERCAASLRGGFPATDAVFWIRCVDRTLLANGWQDVPFINPANLVFVYMLVRDSAAAVGEANSVSELRSTVMTCLYLSYAYMGHEISYPVKPFVSAEEDRGEFWGRCIRISNETSSKMLALNNDPVFFTQLFRELASYSFGNSGE